MHSLLSSVTRSCLALLLAAPVALAQRESPFMAEFRKLMQIQGKDEMVALMRKHQTEAILAIRETAQLISDGSSDELETDMQALVSTFEKAFDSRFAQIEYDYFSLRLTGEFKKKHKELQTRYIAKLKDYNDAAAKKDANLLAAVAQEFDSLGLAFGELGDDYLTAECCLGVAKCFSEELVGSKADLRRVCDGWKGFIAARDKCELQDTLYTQAKELVEHLETTGFGDPSKGPEARAAATAAEKAATDSSYTATPLKATFELVPDLEALQRPLYTADTNYQLWAGVSMAKQGTTATFQALEKSPTVVRTGATKAAVDLNGDGTGEVEIALTGKITPVQLTLGEGDEARPWAFLAVNGIEQDTYQGFKLNLAPTTDFMTIYVAPAASLVGMVNGVRVQVFDDNMDGVYGSPPKEWQYIGVVEGSTQRDVDSVRIGEEKFARPWSRLQKIGDAWYKLEPTPTGVDLQATRQDVETGTMQLDIKGVEATWMIVRGTGEQKDLFFDIASGGANTVELPAGGYELYVGQVAMGKRAQMAKALVLPGKNTPLWKVSPGSPTKVALGAPFGFQFTFKQDEKTVTVEGPSIAVTGRSQETYQRLWNCVVTAEVNLRKAGSGKGKKEGKLQPVTSQEPIYQEFNNDYRVVWFPVTVPLDKPKENETVEVQLFEKKNKLFGKIESEWIAN
jgi:hypothetical protein